MEQLSDERGEGAERYPAPALRPENGEDERRDPKYEDCPDRKIDRRGVAVEVCQQGDHERRVDQEEDSHKLPRPVFGACSVDGMAEVGPGKGEGVARFRSVSWRRRGQSRTSNSARKPRPYSCPKRLFRFAAPTERISRCGPTFLNCDLPSSDEDRWYGQHKIGRLRLHSQGYRPSASRSAFTRSATERTPGSPSRSSGCSLHSLRERRSPARLAVARRCKSPPSPFGLRRDSLHSLCERRLVGPAGLEPATSRLKVACSTN